MSFSIFFALSPLDGRYSSQVEKLRPIFSEAGFTQHRIKVEIAWLQELITTNLIQIQPTAQVSDFILNKIIDEFSELDLIRIKEIENITQHDVKALEYWLKEKINNIKDLAHISQFIHFACTSEDINNAAYGLMLKTARNTILLPALQKITQQLTKLAYENAAIPMLARTHGQSASSTTVGKEISNFVSRLQRSMSHIASITILAKMNGAVGNYNAHYAAFPEINWPEFAKNVVEKKLGLTFNTHTTQIEPHDYMAELFHAISRTNTILIDLNRDIWSYISFNYFQQHMTANEIGSSTMPHKINPIDFENSEGNLGLANAILQHLSNKLPISRLQRDLTDSTVLRNIGVAFGHTLVAYNSCLSGLNKLQVNSERLAQDLDTAWETLAEPIQIVMRRYGIKNSYETLKSLTRGKLITQKILHKFIHTLAIPQIEKDRLLAMKPASYIGHAKKLAKTI